MTEHCLHTRSSLGWLEDLYLQVSIWSLWQENLQRVTSDIYFSIRIESYRVELNFRSNEFLYLMSIDFIDEEMDDFILFFLIVM